MKRLTREEAAEWRRKSAEAYRARAKAQWATRRAEKPKKPPTPQQVRKVAENAEYRVNHRLKLIQVNYRCERIYSVDDMRVRCTRTASQTHHKRRRSNGVDHSLDNLLATCAQCHAIIHAEVAASKAEGTLRAQWPQLLPKSQESLIDESGEGA